MGSQDKQSLRIALAQTDNVPATSKESHVALRKAAQDAAAGGAGLVMFPELFWCGYGDGATTRRLALVQTEAESIFGKVAAETGTALLVGYSEAVRGGFYNSAMLVDAHGHMALNYRKMHLWGTYESAVFLPGAPSPIVEILPGLRAGVLICFDLDFPAPAQDLAQRGATLILVMSATSYPYRIVPGALVLARAYENSVFLAFCNHAGSVSGNRFVGASTLAAPDGSILASAGGDQSEMVVGNVSLPEFARYRQDHHYAPMLRHDLFPASAALPGPLR